MTASLPTTTAPALCPGARPMASEQVDAHLTRLEHLLADLEAAATALADASWGPSSAPETARFLPDGSRQPLVAWAQRITSRLAEVAEQADVADS